MQKTLITLCAAVLVAMGVSAAGAATINLAEYKVNSDASSFTDNLTGSTLGSYTFHFASAGSHYGGIFLDYEIDEAVNTFFNEFGGTDGSAPVGLTFEIDEPGFKFGDIYDNFVNRSLDNKIFGGSMTGPEDVSLALYWDFTLGAGATADLTFTASDKPPLSGFCLIHSDPDSQADIYLSANLRTSNEPIPEPATVLLLGVGLCGLAIFGNKRRNA